MPSFSLEQPRLANQKHLSHRKLVGERRLQVARATHVGRVLLDLDREERQLRRAFKAADGIESVKDQADALSKLTKALDTVRERRRILLGEPLPGSRRAGTERKPILHAQVLDVEPTPTSAALTISTTVAPEPDPGA